jgi:hypothetical protein
MTSKQKRIIAILATANVIAVVVLTVLVARLHSTDTSLPSSSHTPTLFQDSCQWKVTHMLAQAGLGGTVALTSDGSLRFEIVHPLQPGATADDVAQLVWLAFDVALAAQEQGDECSRFTQVEVAILVQSDQADTQIQASVSAADLAAFGAGELTETEFIERVAYTVTPVP